MSLSHRALATGALLAAVCGVTLSAGQAVRPLGDERVTVVANGVPLVTLLKDLEAVYPLEKLNLDPKVASRPVTLTLENVYPERALGAILEASEVDYVINGRRVIAGDWEGSPGENRRATLAARRAELQREMAVRESPVDPPIVEQERANPQAAEPFAEAGAQAGAGEFMPVATGEAQRAGTAGVRFRMRGENVEYEDPGFVPYKLTPAARAARERADLSKIP